MLLAPPSISLRPRQEVFVSRCHAALQTRGNTVGVATVGFGKTIALSALAAMYPRSLVLQHRIELLEQNRAKFQRVAPDRHTATFAAGHKRWAEDGHTFAMMQTLSTEANRAKMHPVDLLVIDEGHHAPAEGYQRIIADARELNPNVQLLAVTATPDRCDGKSLRPNFDNVADIVQLREMIESGFLVRPRTFIIELPGMTEAIAELKKGKGDFNMDAAAQLLDLEPVTDRIVEEWMKEASDRRTIGFATNVAHSKHMTEAFRLAGVAVEHVDGTTPPGERRAIWRRLRTGETQMVWNCAVATEGFDEPGIGCVILARPAMHRSTMIQMIGRGLRTISEPENYPRDFIKEDCIVFDFGASLITHGSLEVEADIDGREGKSGEAPTKDCPKCETTIPMGCRKCPICGYEFLTMDKDGKTMIGDFVMTEIDLLALSPFRWEDLWEDTVMVAEALTASVILVNYGGLWWAYGCRRGQKIALLSRTPERAHGIAKGNDFLRLHGDKDHAKKTKRWLTEPLSDKQAEILGEPPFKGILFGPPPINRYVACCRITWKFNESKIQQSIFSQMN